MIAIVRATRPSMIHNRCPPRNSILPSGASRDAKSLEAGHGCGVGLPSEQIATTKHTPPRVGRESGSRRTRGPAGSRGQIKAAELAET
jgi:hypothetical protein